MVMIWKDQGNNEMSVLTENKLLTLPPFSINQLYSDTKTTQMDHIYFQTNKKVDKILKIFHGLSDFVSVPSPPVRMCVIYIYVPFAEGSTAI